MELNRLRVFVVVAAECSIRQAAVRLGISQPAVTMQLRALEADLGMELVQRHQQRIMGLTPAGERYLVAARQTLMRTRLEIEVVRDLGRLGTPVVRIGICEGTATASPFWSALGQSLSAQVACRYVEVPPREMVRLVEGNTLDAGFIPLLAELRNVGAQPIWKETWVAVLPEDHPLAGKAELTAGDLRHETVILNDRDKVATGHLLIEGAFADAGISPARIIRLSRRSTMLMMVAAGQGITFLPASLKTLPLSRLCMVPFRAAPLPVGLIVSPAPKPVTALLEEAVQAILPEVTA